MSRRLEVWEPQDDENEVRKDPSIGRFSGKVTMDETFRSVHVDIIPLGDESREVTE